MQTRALRLFRPEDHGTGHDDSCMRNGALVGRIVFLGDRVVEVAVEPKAQLTQIAGCSFEFTKPPDVRYWLCLTRETRVPMAVDWSRPEEAKIVVGPTDEPFALIANADFGPVYERCRDTANCCPTPASALLGGPDKLFLAASCIERLVGQHGPDWYRMPRRRQHDLIDGVLDSLQQRIGAHDRARAVSIIEQVIVAPIG